LLIKKHNKIVYNLRQWVLQLSANMLNIIEIDIIHSAYSEINM